MRKFILLIFLLSVVSCDDTSKPAPKCGDGIINQESEECDSSYSGTDSCESLGYYGGEIICSNECSLDLSQCVAAGTCGDGTTQNVETEENCCEDTGCSRGVCNNSADGCVDAWSEMCSEGEGCSTDLPWECATDEPPVYNCGLCGCPGDKVCTYDVCYDQAVLDSARNSYMPPDDKPLDWYFKLVDKIMSPETITYDEFLMELEIRLRADARHSTILFGESHGSQDEQLTGMGIMKSVLTNGWNITGLGIEDNGQPLLDPSLSSQLGVTVTGISGDLTNVSYCNAAIAAGGDLLNSEGVYFQYSGSGHTTREAALWDMHWGICSFPHVSECLLKNSKLPVTIILFDPNIWMTLIDQTLMWGAGNYFTDKTAVIDRLDEVIARWDVSFSSQDKAPEYDVTFDATTVNVRMMESENYDDVWFAFFPRPNRQPWLTKGYRTLWDVIEIQDFLFDNSILPGNCSVSWNLTPGEEVLTYWCHKDALELNATVDASAWTVSDYTITP